MNRAWLPLVGFGVLAAFLGIGLTLNPREVPSPLIGKAAPAFSLPTLAEPQRQFSVEDAKGKVWLLNVWASWCTPCLEEHPVIDALSRSWSPPPSCKCTSAWSISSTAVPESSMPPAN